jgi:hypothetical protein
MKVTTTKNDKIVGRPIRLNKKVLTVGPAHYSSVVFIGDAHFGSRQFDKERFLNMLKYCIDNKVYIQLMGDLLEVGTKGSVGAGVFEQTCNADNQFEQMVEWLRPLAKRKLIVGLHRGNHCERVYKDCGVDISKAMARELGVSYLADACWNQFRVGSQTYSIYSMHGRTGSRFDGTALLAVERISTSFFADLVAMG